MKVHRLRLPGRSLCSIRSNRKWCKRRGSSLQCQNCFFVYPIIDCNLKNCLNRIVSCLKKLETSVLLADDIMPDKMILCQLMLLSQGVNIIGLDMQNNIEVDKTEQKYCKIKENKTSKYHYAKIRKSVEKIKKWNIFE